MKGHLMKTPASTLIVVALWCASSAFAQMPVRGPQRCPPGDPHCGQPQWRNDRDPRVDDRRGPSHARPPVFQREPGADFRRNDRYQGPGRDFYRGDRMPQEYRSKQYVVDDWRGHGLRRPPRGYHWVQNGGDYLLVAITTGIILELLLSQ